MTGQLPCDIAIIVPKADELHALEWGFATQFARSSGALATSGKNFYVVRSQAANGSPSLSINVVFMNGQGNTLASQVAQEVINQLDPRVLFLFGTAAGRENKVGVGDVIFSSQVVDATEWRLEEKENPRITMHEQPEQIATDISRFVENPGSLASWQRELGDRVATLPKGVETARTIWARPPLAKREFIAASNYLHLNPDFLVTLWNHDDRIRCIDMESGGFGGTCKRSVGRQWAVVRGISDYGTKESKEEGYRIVSAAGAAVLLRRFIEKGLVESHPNWLRVPESPQTLLPEDSLFSKFDVISFVKERLQSRMGMDLREVELGGSLSITDLEAICVSRGRDRVEARKILTEIREEYFTEKYLSYDYEDDLRGLVPHWHREIRRILGDLAVDLRGKDVLDVGIGNGLEVRYLFTGEERLRGVDLSRAMLSETSKQFPWIETVHASAEDLGEIDTASVDVYISLRTFQSSLFDILAALREAHRVLKRRGAMLISIANGFVVRENGGKRVVRGLLIPGTRVVDKYTPRRLTRLVEEKLSDMGFESVGFYSGRTDVYIWGIRP